MRFVVKLTFKLILMAVMIVLLSGGIRYAQPYLMKVAGLKAAPVSGGKPKFSSDESDLMSTVFQSALRLVSGQATRKELAGEISDKLYAGRANKGEMAELGIEIVKPGEAPSDGKNAAGPATASAGSATAHPGEHLPVSQGHAGPRLAGAGGQPLGGSLRNSVDMTLLNRVIERAKTCSVELAVAPVVLLGMFAVGRKRRRSSLDELMPVIPASLIPSDSEPYDMRHAVHSMRIEEFEMLVALVYQRQGYRISMPAGLGGGKGGDFMLMRKSEKILVQCKRLNQDHRVHVDRVRELHEAVAIAGATRGLYVASCGFSWDARNYGKRNGITVINARTLDEQLSAARANPGEDLLDVSQWAPALMTKIQFTTPTCPSCEAPMEQIDASSGSFWVCSQRPDCRGRRSPRTQFKSAPPASRVTGAAPAATVLPSAAAPVPATAAPVRKAAAPVQAAAPKAQPVQQPAPIAKAAPAQRAVPPPKSNRPAAAVTASIAALSTGKHVRAPKPSPTTLDGVTVSGQRRAPIGGASSPGAGRGQSRRVSAKSVRSARIQSRSVGAKPKAAAARVVAPSQAPSAKMMGFVQSQAAPPAPAADSRAAAPAPARSPSPASNVQSTPAKSGAGYSAVKTTPRTA